MTVRVTRWAGLSLFVAAGACLIASGVPAGAAAPAVGSLPAGAAYVALGDSYSAGYGIAPSTGEPVAGCDQSAADYPHQVAAALGLTLTDVSCSGAVTANIDQTPQTEFPGGVTGSAPLQLDALSADTRVVTVTIGGNDLGFSSIAQQCFALQATGPVAGPPNAPFSTNDCQSFLAGPTQTQLTTVVAPALARVFGSITAAAPNAKVFVVEYPALAPTAANIPSGGCFRPAFDQNGIPGPYPVDSYPFTDVDVPFLQQLQADLVSTIDSAATAAGATVVPAFAASDSHSPCAATADQWVNGITVQSASINPPSVTTVPGALHPNPTGVSYLTSQVQAAITAAFPAASPVPSTPAPAPTVTPRTPQLAVTGTTHTAPLTWTALGLLAAGGAVVFTARRRPARHEG